MKYRFAAGIYEAQRELLGQFARMTPRAELRKGTLIVESSEEEDFRLRLTILARVLSKADLLTCFRWINIGQED